jgi:hypothetical protein
VRKIHVVAIACLSAAVVIVYVVVTMAEKKDVEKKRQNLTTYMQEGYPLKHKCFIGGPRYLSFGYSILGLKLWFWYSKIANDPEPNPCQW